MNNLEDASHMLENGERTEKVHNMTLLMYNIVYATAKEKQTISILRL